MKCAALITAGGAGLRMGGAIPKQYMLLDGIPILSRTVMAFESHDFVDFIVITVPSGDERYCLTDIIRRFNLKKVRSVVAGGDTRQMSVLRGLEHSADSDFVAIHDGVRPLVSSEIISSTFRAAQSMGAALACLPIK